MPAGRKTKYTKDMLVKAEHYLLNYADYDHVIPSIVGLTEAIGELSLRTLTSWKAGEVKSIPDEFLLTLEKIEDKQHIVLFNKGLKGEFNAAITKLGLHNHGYSEKQEIESNNKHEHTLKDLDQLTDAELERIAAGRS